MPHDYDSPWKEAIENLFQDFMTFFFPGYADQIDWKRPHEFLDKELEKIVRDAKLGRRYADKLVKVWLKTGQSIAVYIHIEIQQRSESAFSERMYVYNHRIFERYVGTNHDSKNQVASFAILCFPDKNDQASAYEREFWGSKVTFTFPVVKMTDYQSQWSALEQSDNLFAVVVMAHLKAVAVQDDEERKYWKFKLMKGLYQRGLARIQILELFRFIDWLIDLPEELNQQFWSELYALEEEKSMTYVTSVERMGIKKGLQQGFEQNARASLIEILEDKFDEAVPGVVIETIETLTDLGTLRALLKKAAKSASMDQFMRAFEKTV